MKKVAIALLFAVLTGHPALSAPKAAPPPAPHVVDATGAVVGTLLSQNFLMMQLNGTKVLLLTQREGFLQESAEQERSLYTSGDCTGTRYLSAQNLPVAAHQTPVGGALGASGTATLRYPAPPYVARHFFSRGTGPTDCSAVNFVAFSGLEATTTVQFVTPFDVK